MMLTTSVANGRALGKDLGTKPWDELFYFVLNFHSYYVRAAGKGLLTRAADKGCWQGLLARAAARDHWGQKKTRGTKWKWDGNGGGTKWRDQSEGPIRGTNLFLL